MTPRKSEIEETCADLKLIPDRQKIHEEKRSQEITIKMADLGTVGHQLTKESNLPVQATSAVNASKDESQLSVASLHPPCLSGRRATSLWNLEFTDFGERFGLLYLRRKDSGARPWNHQYEPGGFKQVHLHQ